MHLETIHIQDFRNIEDALIELKPLTVIRGANHNGKTSVKQAIKIGFTGSDEGTTADGKGANDKIRLGAKKARIDLGIRAKSGPLPFSITYGPNRTGRQIVSENVPAPFLKWLEVNNERLNCALDSEYFVRQKPDDQKNILAALVLPQTAEFDPAMVQLANEQFAPLMNWNLKPLDVIEKAYSTAFEFRKTAKAQAAANHIPQLPVNKPSHGAQAVREKLQTLREKATRLRATVPTLDLQNLQDAMDEQAEVGGQLFRAEAELEGTRTAMTDVESNILAPAALKTYERVAAQRKQFDNLQAQINVILEQIEDQRTVVAIWQDLLVQQTCPTCRQKITEVFVNERIAEAEQTIKNQGIKQNELMRDQRELGNIEEAERMLEAHKDAQGQKDTFQRRLAAEVRDVTTLKEKMRDVKVKVSAAQGAKQDAGRPTPELDQTNQEIAQWESKLEESVRYDSVVAQVTEASARARELAAKVEAFERLCTYFGKDGIKARLIHDNINAFEATLNRVLNVWGYEAQLQIEPYSFMVHDLAKKDGLPLKELSGSERLMFGVALQTAIAYHGKVGMVVIDKADTFIDAERGKLFKALMTLIKQGWLEQAVVMVAESKTEAPAMEGVVYYAAQAGKMVKL